MSYIHDIGIAVPQYKISQADVFKKVQAHHAPTETEARLLNYLYQKSKIDFRYSALPDFSNDDNSFLQMDADTEQGITNRQAFYEKESMALAIQAIQNLQPNINTATITHLITVSCTGFSAPGLDIQLIDALQLPTNTQRTSINFMGCYAAIHGLKQANAICHADANAVVLCVCVELCTLHFQKNKTIDNVTSTAIFGDGAAAFVMSNNKQASNYKVKDFYSEILLEGKKEMGWQISEHGFLMTLSKQIPEFILQNVKQFIDHAFVKYKLFQVADTQFCIHPGGKKIVEAAEKGLQLNNNELAESYTILKNYGNMSSPTILFVLKEIIKNKKNKLPIVGLAFGPGLTIESFLLQYDS
jgi:predicted naringenin-chalcone synthase